MRLAAGAGPAAGTSIWQYGRGAVRAIGIWTERVPGGGEDAEPLLEHHLPSGAGIVGVFDGSGGSGSATAFESRDGTPRSGAWVGSHVARAGVVSWFRRHIAGDGRLGPDSLQRHLAALLAVMRPAARSKLTGTILRELPSTMAVVHYARRGGGRVICRAMWAGDSRAYTLSPGRGLQALTRDHTVESDTLQQLLRDPPLTNVLNASGHFTVDFRQVELELPCVLLCATDGLSGYVATPAHFEYHLLESLQAARDEHEWAARLAAQVAAGSGDDASLSLVALGYPDLGSLRQAFACRTEHLWSRYWRDRPSLGDPLAAVRLWQERTWGDYRGFYEELMPGIADGRRI
ncbi:PP2C family protein-serine/threonine phosphatase [Sinosporangium siamense]|uniref:Serine/threonine protein phosphatase PrpC n=1 Tax=Sinosporangium siamense TaxID=1367973 RepID=A0A919RNJ1_9ACTN|nr:protein phosphatase 2C domain-containing protein [Sinosporangium siamense]GII95471.1 hypothetical protein Ssi02_57020 [Sinosporangium siamense]